MINLYELPLFSSLKIGKSSPTSFLTKVLYYYNMKLSKYKEIPKECNGQSVNNRFYSMLSGIDQLIKKRQAKSMELNI